METFPAFRIADPRSTSSLESQSISGDLTDIRYELITELVPDSTLISTLSMQNITKVYHVHGKSSKHAVQNNDPSA
jgi:hypothetical protein